MDKIVVAIIQSILQPRVALVFGIALVVILCIPLPETLQLGEFKSTYGVYLGALAILCFVSCTTQYFLIYFAKRKTERDVLSHFYSLSLAESALLRGAVKYKDRVVAVEPCWAEGTSLVAKGMLTPIPHMSGLSHKYLILPFVWRYINDPKNGFSNR